MFKSPKISIITPNYNYSKFIGKTIQSVIEQDYNNWEYIIVDDGSTDNSVAIIEKFVKKHPDKIKLIKQKNHGQTHAVNRALSEVTGDIIGWINSDDLYCSNVFSLIAEYFKNETIDAVHGDIEIINHKGELIKVNKYLPFNYTMGVFKGFGKVISSNAIFWKKELTDKIGLLNESFVYAMDSDYWSRLLYKRNIIKINVPVAKFRWHSEAKTIKKKNRCSENYKIAQN